MDACNNPYPGKSVQWLLGKMLCWLVNTAASAGGFSSSIIQFPLPALPYGSDYVVYTYSGDDVTTATYKTGGSGGTTVKTITYTYNVDGNVETITAS